MPDDTLEHHVLGQHAGTLVRGIHLTASETRNAPHGRSIHIHLKHDHSGERNLEMTGALYFFPPEFRPLTGRDALSFDDMDGEVEADGSIIDDCHSNFPRNHLLWPTPAVPNLLDHGEDAPSHLRSHEGLRHDPLHCAAA